MAASAKISKWDGHNKDLARALKVHLILRYLKSGFLATGLRMLTFAGAKAHFERMVVRRGYTTPDKIVTIQSAGKIGAHDGAPVLRSLLQEKHKQLKGMYIWPSTFDSFAAGYQAKRVYTPSVTGNPPAWFRSPTFRAEMHRFLQLKPQPFDVLDIDMCGIFSEANGMSISKLMQNQMLARRGLLFINHQKGRDARGGRLCAWLKQYFRYCNFFDIDSFTTSDGHNIDLDVEDEETYYQVRYILVPIFYVCEAFKAGYHLDVERLLEYRDKNKSSGAGVNMLQWYFTFERARSASLPVDSKEFIATLERDVVRLKESIWHIAQEAYPYSKLMD